MDLNRVQIALIGWKRCGKDEVSRVLIRDHGFQRHSFGDIIKRQLDDVIQKHLGFSAFTEFDPQKNVIRPFLEVWSDINNTGLLQEFLDSIPARAVNNRCVKLTEAKAWVDRGGVIVWIDRPGAFPASKWEEEQISAVKDAGLIQFHLNNDGDLDSIIPKVSQLLAQIASKPKSDTSLTTGELPLW